MSKRIIVSLVSEQTIPNIEFIKEKQNESDTLLFLSTYGMEEKGNRQWILNVVGQENFEDLEPIIVDPFSFEDIESKLSEFINDNDYYIVNLTGGTKVMSLAVYDFFKKVNAEMYYLSGKGKYIKVHPGRTKSIFDLNAKISLKEYLNGYGFELSNQSRPLCSYEQAVLIKEYFLNSFNKEDDIETLESLRLRREKNTSIESIPKLQEYLDRIKYKEIESGKLNKYEARYLSGDWLEEYLYYFLIKKLNIKDQEIGLSWLVLKDGSKNEFDVLVMKNNKLYMFECKTSIYLDSDESQTFIGDTIYKSDSLRNKLGLFAQTIIFTLSDLSKEKLNNHVSRAEASKVKLIDRDFLNDEEKLIEFLEKL